jgi:predicted MPP superfamily phosphohydrolase
MLVHRQGILDYLKMNLSRRKFIRNSAVGAFLGASAIGVFEGGNTTSALELVEHEVVLERLPKAFDGYRVGFLSDTHLGVYVPTEWVDEAVSLLERKNIDMLLMGGDFIWLPDRDVIESLYPIRNPKFLRDEDDRSVCADIFSTIADVTARLKPKDGVFAVFGNHDRWTDPGACKKSFGTRGIKILENEKITVNRGGENLAVIGVDDYWTGVPRLPVLAPRQAKNEGRILVSHNPDYVSELLGAGKPDIDFTLSGHTHGGQVKLPFLGPIHCNIEDTRFREGFYRDKGLISYTSRGVGVVEIPFRLNCPPEVTVFTLRPI